MSVVDYYETGAEQVCDLKYFDEDKFTPLYLSFERKDQLKLTYKLEQKIFTYKVNYSSSDSIFISRGKNLHRIYISNDTLTLKYNKNLIPFKKVSDNFSSDVFGEYMKGIIFKKHENYLVSSFMGKAASSVCIIKKENFKKKIKEIFKCDYIDFVQLGLVRVKNNCLPTIALYYNNSKETTNPYILGILMQTDEVNFIDVSGINVLTLKSN